METIKTIKVTRTISYSPESYIEFCEEESETPTQDGFLEYVSEYIDEDYNNGNGCEDISYED